MRAWEARGLANPYAWCNNQPTLVPTACPDVSLLVTVCLEPMVVKVGGEESLATVAEQVGVGQCSDDGHLCYREVLCVIKPQGAGYRMS